MATKYELEQQVAGLQQQLDDIGQLHETAKTLRNVGEWDREAQTISRCVKALDRIADTSGRYELRSDARGQVARILQYLAVRYGVPMANPKALDDLRREIHDLAGTVGELERVVHQPIDGCGGCER